MDGELEDENYRPLSEDEVSLGDEEFTVPNDPVEQERFKHRLIATAKSLKKKQQHLQADQDLLTDRWTKVLAAEEYGLERPTKSYPKRRLLPHRAGFGPVREVRRPGAQTKRGPIVYTQYIYITE